MHVALANATHCNRAEKQELFEIGGERGRRTLEEGLMEQVADWAKSSVSTIKEHRLEDIDNHNAARLLRSIRITWLLKSSIRVMTHTAE